MSRQAPLISDTIEKETIFSPNQYFEYKKNVEGCDVPSLSENCIMVFDQDMLDYAKVHLNTKKIEWFREQFELYMINENIILIKAHYGAPLSAIALEELIALGVKNIISLGSAGTLQKDVPIGSIIIVESAIREEGTSYHYLLPSKTVNCSASLLAEASDSAIRLSIKVRRGTTWSTDSFYRETLTKAKKYQSEGVLAVDMESSALYAVAKFRRAEMLSIFYVSDSIAELKWNPQFAQSKNSRTNELLFRLAINTLTSNS